MKGRILIVSFLLVIWLAAEINALHPVTACSKESCLFISGKDGKYDIGQQLGVPVDVFLEDIKQNENKDISAEVKGDEKKVLMHNGGTININGNKYPVVGEAVFIFDADGKLAKGTHFTLDKSDSYQITDSVHSLPEGSEVKHEEDGISIIIPDNGKIGKMPAVNQEKKDSTPINYKTVEGGRLILPNDDPVKAAEIDGKRGVAVLNWDGEKGLFNTERAEIDGFETGYEIPYLKKGKNVKTYLIFDDGKMNKDFEGNYISLGNSANDYQMAVGSTGKSDLVRILPGIRYGGLTVKESDVLILQTDGGHMSFRSQGENEIPLLEQRGRGLVFNGNTVSSVDANNEHTILVDPILGQDGIKKKFEGGTSAPLKIVPRDRDGNLLTYTVKENGKDVEKLWNGEILFREGELFVVKDGKVVNSVKLSEPQTEEKSQMKNLDPVKQREVLRETGIEKPIAELIDEKKKQKPPAETLVTAKPGYFTTDVGINMYTGIPIHYITIPKLEEISAGKYVTVYVTEPKSCPACAIEVTRLNYQGNFITTEQAREMGWRGGGIPATIYVRDGKIVQRK
jgi:hypothetical protein